MDERKKISHLWGINCKLPVLYLTGPMMMINAPMTVVINGNSNRQDVVIFNNLIFDLHSTRKAGCMDINLVNQNLNSESY